MSEHQPAPDQHASDALPGTRLKLEREHQGLSRDEVATQLNLRPSLVDDLERDHYDQIPIAAYRRGYLRAYARLLGMDEKAIVGQYNAQFGTTEAERYTPSSTPSVRPPGKMGKYLFRLVSLLVIAGLIGLSYVWWQSGDYGRTSPAETSALEDGSDADSAAPVVNADGSIELSLSQSSASEAAPSSTATATGDASAIEAATSSEATAQSADALDTNAGAPGAAETGTQASDAATESAATTDVSTVADASADTSQESAAEDAAPAADPRKLELTFNINSWTDIRDADGERLLRGNNEAGTSTTLEGKPPFTLTIGNASGVELRYMNEAVDLTRVTRGSVAKLTLGE
ncbi:MULTISPECIES: RodZ domain-containing protein [unclassified Cobetia]|uniref:RodZ domain-containing protein n=1 Tax=unclassified Cobetia TaxID=2609414 RepID=UPI0020978B7F|nr:MULTISPECIES: RodZ domain-containing protein [unclassified Cobetia]MCO7233597.1 DUF4115 domain-containing protein [Cobetia sp. Dlab-2-AX]MCO7236931.1 DUF4115 domain-containing protein [Cobetia sp. Dlab-2-U]